MDIAMPLLNGFEATRQILLVRRTKVLVLSAHSTTSMWRTCRSRASGYLVKQNSGRCCPRIKEIVAALVFQSVDCQTPGGSGAEVARGGAARESPDGR